MHVARLSLTDFRSYADAVVAPGPGFVILTGDNGAGKTNLLEAVSLLAPGRGLRGATLSEMSRQSGPGGFAVAARLNSDGEGDIDIGTGAAAVAPNGARCGSTARRRPPHRSPNGCPCCG